MGAGAGFRFRLGGDVRSIPKAILTAEQLQETVDYFMECDEFAFDTETKGDPDGLNPLTNEVTWISLATHGKAVAIPVAHEHGEVDVPAHVYKYTIDAPPDDDGVVHIYQSGPRKGEPRKLNRSKTMPPTYHPPPEQLTPGAVFAALRPLFFSERRKVGHNIPFDLKTVAKYYDDEVPPPPYGETASLHHLLDENLTNYRLGTLVEKCFKVTYDKIGSAKPHLHPFSKATAYSLFDAKFTWLLWDCYQTRLKQQGLSGVLRMEMDLLPGLIAIENEGALIDRVAMEALRDELVQQSDEIKGNVWRDVSTSKRFRGADSTTFNLQSRSDKAWYIYEHRGHKPQVFTAKTGQPSTKADHLRRYSSDKMVATLLDYANVTKTLSTYVEGMLPHLETDGRLHPQFVPYGTVTGRFTCREPNLQNIPRVDEDEANRGRLIRSMFVAPEGHSFIAADYDQIEMRVLAHYSKDPALREIFEYDLDPHAAVAAKVLRKPIEEVTKDERQAGKTTNFLISYGGGPARLAAQTGMGIRRSERFIEDYWREFRKVDLWSARCIRQARTHRPPYVTTLLGRRRRLPELRQSRPRPSPACRAPGSECRDPRLVGGHHQDRHDPSRRPLRGYAAPTGADGARRVDRHLPRRDDRRGQGHLGEGHAR